MAIRPSASKAVEKRLRSLDRGLKGHLDTDAEALHRTRVATRRLREALPLFVPTEGSPPLTDLKRLIQHVTRALGGVREMDVALELVATLIGERPDLEPALTLVESALTRERAVRLERMRRRVDARQLRRASQSLAQHVGDLADAVRPAEVLAERLSERVQALRRAVSDAGLLYAPERLHRVRIAAKKLRYALELAHEMGAAATRRLVTDLQRVQAGLGLLHDLETVTRHARQTLGDPDIPGAAAPLAAPTLSLLEEKIHAQHADYLADRDSLLRVVDRAAVVRERVRRHGSQRETAGDARRPPGLRTE